MSSAVGVAKAADFLASFSPVESCQILNALWIYLAPRYSLTSQTASKRDTRLARSARMWRQGCSQPADRFFLTVDGMSVSECLGESSAKSLGEALHLKSHCSPVELHNGRW